MITRSETLLRQSYYLLLKESEKVVDMPHKAPFTFLISKSFPQKPFSINNLQTYPQRHIAMTRAHEMFIRLDNPLEYLFFLLYEM